ncbi:heme exporter protein CcmD [Sphingomonas sp. ZT3P38]|jgi:heme exporter protein CcmD
MNPWPFVIAAYGITFAGVGGLVLWSWLAMRRSERP